MIIGFWFCFQTQLWPVRKKNRAANTANGDTVGHKKPVLCDHLRWAAKRWKWYFNQAIYEMQIKYCVQLGDKK